MLTIERLTRRFGDFVAVDSVDLEIPTGQMVGVIGRSGAGKSTLLRMIDRLVEPSEGRIVYESREITALKGASLRHWRRDCAMVFQQFALVDRLDVLTNVMMGRLDHMPEWRSLLKLWTADDKAIALSALELFDIANLAANRAGSLSGGQQQRVAVARALVLEPEVLLFDEPLSNLDAKLRRKMRDDIRELQSKLGLTSVYVTHDQEEALAVSDRIIVMNRAVIAQEGSPSDLYRRPVSRFVADFMGISNLLDGIVIARADGRVKVRCGEATLDLPAPTATAADDVTVAIRPQGIRLEAEAAPDRLPVTVRKATYLGSHLEYVLDSDAGELFVVDPTSERAVPPGSGAWAAFRHDGVALVPRGE